MSPAFDTFGGFQPHLTSPLTDGFAVTPNDSLDLAFVPRALMVGGAGALKVTMQSGQVLVLPALQPGVVYPIRVTRVWATGSTATGVVSLS